MCLGYDGAILFWAKSSYKINSEFYKKNQIFYYLKVVTKKILSTFYKRRFCDLGTPFGTFWHFLATFTK